MTASRRLPALFLIALAGVLLLVGVGAAELGGWPAVAAYLLVVLALVVVVIRRARAAVPDRRHESCSCCNGEPFRGVEVV